MAAELCSRTRRRPAHALGDAQIVGLLLDRTKPRYDCTTLEEGLRVSAPERTEYALKPLDVKRTHMTP